MDLNFEQLLANHNQEFKEAEVYSNWMPDDGEYIVTVVKSDNGVSSKDGTDLAWWKLTGRIEDVQDEKLNEREFPVGYFTSRAYGILKGAARVLSGNSNLDDLGEAHAVLEASPGLVLRVRVRTSISRKNGQEYTNCFILKVIDTIVSAGDVPVEETTTQELVDPPLTEAEAIATSPEEPIPAAVVVDETPAEAPPE